MKIRTLLALLCGRRDAVLQVAASREAIWLGLLFVLSAGLAREYDGEDLLHAPWHLALPAAASLLSSAILFLLVYGVARVRGAEQPAMHRCYRVFLTLYWMMAPMAWLYAFPVERFTTPAGATAANLSLLAVVSLWRVALMTRVISVLYCCRIPAAAMLVMLFADGLALVALHFVPLPIFSVMGGIRLTESEQLIRDVACLVQVFGTLLMPVWLIGVVVVAIPVWHGRRWQWAVPAEQASAAVSKPLWCLAGALLLGGVALLPLTQGEQQNRHYVEQAMADGNIEQALRFMSARRRHDFPPHWDPPPRIAYGQHEPQLSRVLDSMLQLQTADWVRAIYMEKLLFHAGGPPWAGDVLAIQDMDDVELERFVLLLQTLPEGPEVAYRSRNRLKMLLRNAAEVASSRRRELLEKLLGMARQFEQATESARPEQHEQEEAGG